MYPNRNHNPAFTLVELLVTISIIGVLGALLIPAVQRARESVRLTSCQNNLRQVGLAFQNYHSAYRTLPAAAIWDGPPGEPLGGGTSPIGTIDHVARGLPGPGRMSANWVIALLPHLELNALYDRYNFRVPVNHDDNRDVRETSLTTLLCASDPFSSDPYVRDGINGFGVARYARGNFAMNFGPDRSCITNVDPSGCVAGVYVDALPLDSANTQVWGSGLGGVNKSFTYRDVGAGLSHTVIVDEVRAGPSPYDSRGVWSLGFAGSSVTARHGLADKSSDAYGPNNQNTNADDIIGCENSVGPANMMMPCNPGAQHATQATARSLHPGGVNTLHCDGSISFVSDSVDLRLWYSKHRRDAGRSSELEL